MTTEPEVIGARGATSVGVASLIAAAAGYVVLLIVARTVSVAQNAEFLTFWGLLFFLFGVLGGVQNEATRSVHVARAAGAPVTAKKSVGVLPAGLMVGGIMSGAILLSGGWWGHRVLGDAPWPLLVVLALATFAYSGHAAVAGALAGSGQWGTDARLVGAESTGRLALVTGVALVGAGKFGLATACAASAGTWFVLAGISRRVRGAVATSVEDSTPQYMARTAQALLATAASAAIAVGFPVLLRISTTHDVYLGAAPLVLAVQMTRAPLMLPLMAYQGVAITYFVAHIDRGAAPLLRLGAIVLGVGALGGALAALVGPWLMVAFYGPEYWISGVTLGALTLAAAFLGMLTLSGAAVLAMGRHATYAAGWVAATAVTVAVLLIPAPLEARTAIGLAVGPAVGVLVHLAAIRWHGWRGR